MQPLQRSDESFLRGYPAEFVANWNALAASMDERLRAQAERFKHLVDGKRYVIEEREDSPAFAHRGQRYEGVWEDRTYCFHVTFHAGDSKGGRKGFTIGIPGVHVDVIGEAPA